MLKIICCIKDCFNFIFGKNIGENDWIFQTGNPSVKKAFLKGYFKEKSYGTVT